MGKTLWSGSDIVRALGISAPVYWPGSLSVTGISIDSRTLAPGDLFVAIKGAKYDGHRFIAAARRAGAVGVVISDQSKPPTQFPYLQVASPRAALVVLGKAARARTSAHIIAVTGSAGKTSTKEMLRFALAANGATHVAERSYNNELGVALSLARMPRDSAYGVFELGMNHAGEIADLSMLVRPHTVIITNIGTAHIENFSDEGAIAAAKAEIFVGLEPGGSVVLPRDSSFYGRLTRAARRHEAAHFYGFGRHRQAFARLLRVASGSDHNLVEADIDGLGLTYRFRMGGVHHAVNSLAALAAVIATGADVHLASRALVAMIPLSGRGLVSVVPCGSGYFTLIDESYNANPLSMAASLRFLADTPSVGRRIAVLGDMAELGHDAADYHTACAALIVDLKIDLVLSCGRHMRHLWRALPKPLRGGHFKNCGALNEAVHSIFSAGDVVMIKGSRAIGMDAVVDYLMLPRASSRASSRTSAGGRR